MLKSYVNKIKENYPKYIQKDIEAICKYGFERIYNIISKGNGVYLEDYDLQIYFGRAYVDNFKNSINYYKTSRNKLRYLYTSNMKEFSGKYYVGLRREEFNKLSAKIKNKKPIILKNVIIYKIKEECLLNTYQFHFLEIEYPIDIGWFSKRKVLKVFNYKYFAKRWANRIIKYIKNE